MSWLLRRLRHERAGCSSGGEWLLPPEGTAHSAALGLGCCAVVAQRGHHCCRSEWCKQACNTRLCAHCLREIVFSPGGTAAAALRLGAAARRGHRCCRSLVGELARHTPQTRCLTCVWRCIVMKVVFSLLHDCLVLYFARHVSVPRSMMCYCCLRVCFDCRESIVSLCVFWLFCVLFFP